MLDLRKSSTPSMAVNLQLRVPGRRGVGREEGMHKAITVKERVKMTTCKCL